MIEQLKNPELFVPILSAGFMLALSQLATEWAKLRGWVTRHKRKTAIGVSLLLAVAGYFSLEGEWYVWLASGLLSGVASGKHFKTIQEWRERRMGTALKGAE